MLDCVVHSFALPIGSRSHDQREDLLDLEVVAELLKFVAVDLCFVIGYECVGDSIPADYVLVDELLDLYGRDSHERLIFNPFSEVVDSYYCVVYTTSPFGKSIN